ncbi:guanylate kinase [Sulfurimonas hongkongensis]|uniref:Guanylate kinase n=2 Tax=Sulfurimonas hongkongensis TaxID=1172190 RepID=T0JS85_9BACT|nr:guanylate kinase [Sulfurimonas hongkongensis]
MMYKKNGVVLVLSGPSGAGKSSLINAIIDDIGDYYFSISTTTRPMRKGEVEGVHYYFVSKEEFQKDIEQDLFLEYALVHGNYYGTSLKPVKEALSQGKLVIFDIDVQGNTAIKNRLGDITTSVFITPPSLSELKKRLINRSTDSKEVIENRIKMAKREIQRTSEYDFVIINDDFDVAASVLKQIAKTARIKVPTDRINEFVQKWEDIEQ